MARPNRTFGPDAPDGRPNGLPPGLPEGLVAKGAIVMRLVLLAFSGLWLSGVGSMFAFLGAELFEGVREVLVYLPAEGRVTRYEPPSEDEFGRAVAGEIAYAYTVDGEAHTGTFTLRAGPHPADDRMAELLDPASSSRAVTVSYDPDDPSVSTLAPRVEVPLIGFLIFMMPFVAVGVAMAGGALFASTEAVLRAAQRKRPPAMAAFIPVYMVASAVTAFVFFGLSFFLYWETALWVGLALWLVGVPMVSISVTLGVARSRRRRARPTAPMPGAEADVEPDDAPAPAVRLPGDETLALPRAAKGVWPLLVFAVVWCGMVSVFVGFIAYSFYRHLDAKHRYLATTGTVAASRLDVSSDSDGTSYGIAVRYEYAVGGETYSGDRFAFGEVKTPERDYWQGVVDRHPPGAAVTVYYDPERPGESVLHLEIHGSLWLKLLFMQPFVLTGAGLVAGVAWSFLSRARLKAFLTTPVAPPRTIPTWGELEHETGGLVVRPRRNLGPVLIAFAAAYGGACFVSIFIVGLLFSSSASPWVVFVAFAAAAGAGLVAAVVATHARQAKAVVHVGDARGVLWVKSPRRDEQVATREIDYWTLRSAGDPERAPAGPKDARFLVAVTRAGRTVPVHLFGKGAAGVLVARKTAPAIAKLSWRPYVPPGQEEEDGPRRPAPSAGFQPPGFDLPDGLEDEAEEDEAQADTGRRGKRKAPKPYADLT